MASTGAEYELVLLVDCGAAEYESVPTSLTTAHEQDAIEQATYSCSQPGRETRDDAHAGTHTHTERGRTQSRALPWTHAVTMKPQ